MPNSDRCGSGFSIGYIADALARVPRIKADHGPPFRRSSGYCCGAASRCPGCPGPEVARRERAALDGEEAT